MNHKDLLKLMGQKVVVHTQLHREREYTQGLNDNRRYWKSRPMEEARTGWVTGIRHVKNGKFHRGDWEDQGYLEIESTTKCLLVAFWPTEKPVCVPLTGFRMWQEEDHEPFCSGWGDTLATRKKTIKMVSDDCRHDWGKYRDEKGRFLNYHEWQKRFGK